MIIDLLFRVIAVCCAFFAAIVAASLFFVLAIVGADSLGARAGPEEWEHYMRLGLVAGVVASLFGKSAVVPVLFAVAIAEALRLRGLILYLAAGTLAGAAATYAWTASRENLTEPEFAIGAAAGAAGALVYWGLAGRNAGRWRERSPEQNGTGPGSGP